MHSKVMTAVKLLLGQAVQKLKKDAEWGNDMFNSLLVV